MAEPLLPDDADVALEDLQPIPELVGLLANGNVVGAGLILVGKLDRKSLLTLSQKQIPGWFFVAFVSCNLGFL